MRADYYERLGLDRNASQTDIKLAYFQLAKEYHPDKRGLNTFAQKRFQAILEAYQQLKTPEGQAKYNDFLIEYDQREMSGASFSSLNANNDNRPYIGLKGFMTWFFEPFTSNKNKQTKT